MISGRSKRRRVAAEAAGVTVKVTITRSIL